MLESLKAVLDELANEEKGTRKVTLKHVSGLLKLGVDDQTIATAFGP